MFKKLASFLVAFSLTVGFAGCSTNQTSEQSTEPTTVQTQTQEPNKETSTLLVPYLAGCKDHSIEGIEKRYGLMTTDGKSVVEPIYYYYDTFERDGKTHYCMIISENTGEKEYYKSLLISADGTWRLELDDKVTYLSENRIVCEKGDTMSHSDEPTNFYDYSGKKIFSSEYSCNGDFNDGLIVLFDDSKGKDYTNTFSDYNDYFFAQTIVVDENGEVVFDDLDYCDPFVDGKAIASEKGDDAGGILASDGTWLLEPKYKQIKEVKGKYFVALDNDKEYIYDYNLNLLRERECTLNKLDTFYEVNGKLIRLVYGENNKYFDAFTDEIIACNNINATDFEWQSNLFYGLSNGDLYIFDVNGKLLNMCESKEHMICYPGTYYVRGSEGEWVWFNEDTHEEIISANVDNSEVYEVYVPYDNGLAYIRDIQYADPGVYDEYVHADYSVYDLEKDEYLFENCTFAEMNKVNGEVYLTVAYKDRVETYDADFNLIIKTENLCEK